MPRRYTFKLGINPRSPNVWTATFYFEGDGGRKVRKSTGVAIGDRPRESERAAAREAERIGDRIAAKAPAVTDALARESFASVAERMLDGKEADGRRSRAVDGLAFWLDKHVIPYFGTTRDVRSIRRADLEGLKAHLLRNTKNERTGELGLSPQSINNALTAARQVLKYACLVDELIEAVPTVANVRTDPTPKGRALTVEQANTLIAHLDPRAIEARHFLLFVANTGMRKSEALAIRFSWVDWERRLLVVPADVVKGGRPRPPVALNEVALAILRERQATPVKRHDPNDDRVFRQTKHDDARNSAAARAGLGRVRTHDLRHTLGSLHVQAGATLSEVRDTLGHRTLEMVSHYQHPYIEQRQAVADRVKITGQTGGEEEAEVCRGGMPGEPGTRGEIRRQEARAAKETRRKT